MNEIELVNQLENEDDEYFDAFVTLRESADRSETVLKEVLKYINRIIYITNFVKLIN